MTTIKIQVNKDEKDLIQKYAERLGLSTAELVRSSVLEKIENDLDRQDADAAYAEYLKNPTAVYSLEELGKEEGRS